MVPADVVEDRKAAGVDLDLQAEDETVSAVVAQASGPEKAKDVVVVSEARLRRAEIEVVARADLHQKAVIDGVDRAGAVPVADQATAVLISNR